MRRKTVLSFYCDDTNPFTAPPEAFARFLDFVASEGAAGESSFIPAYGFADHGGRMPEPYLEQVRRAHSCGIDTHFELMTHSGLYDFRENRMPGGAVHEGLWMREPGVTAAEYEAYFGAIIAEAAEHGVQYTGMTEPGCGCAACELRRAELARDGIAGFNPGVWTALLSLARKGKFRGRTVPCFIGTFKEQCSAVRLAGDAEHGVFDLSPNADDRFGIWLNDPARVDPDYYISADGRTGRIAEEVRAGAPYCVFYCHWQGLNPANGAGWEAFTRVVGRVNEYLRDEVAWMRPSAYTDMLLKEGN
jgi:hypothetical protein